MNTEIQVNYETVTQREPFLDVVGGLLDATRQGSEIHLNFESLRLERSKRTRLFHLIILANVLIGQSGDCPIEVTFPESDPAKLAVIRSGVVFALLNRPDVVMDYGFFNPDGSEVSPEWKRLWTSAWTPVQPMLGSVLLPQEEPRIVTSSDVLSNPNNAKKASRVVIDPHLEFRSKLLFHANNSLAAPWIRSVVPSSGDPELRKRREVWQGPVTEKIIGEPLLNISDHSLTRPSGCESLSHQVRSMVLVARTDGGGVDSHPRRQVLVTDTGYGAVNTLRPKVPIRWPDLSPSSTAEHILQKAITGNARTINDPGLSWARTGFEVAVREAGEAPADGFEHEFTLIAGDGLPGDTVWVSVDPEGSVQTGRYSGIPFIGTTVFASLPIPHGQRKNSTVAEESSGGVLTPT